jgi:hypothetical protein
MMSPMLSFGRRDLDRIDRLEDRGACLLHRRLERERAGHLERHFRRVDGVVRAVGQRHPEIHHRVARQPAALRRFADPLLDGGPEVLRDRAAEDLVGELEAGAAGQRLELDPAIAELAAPAGLLLVRPLRGADLLLDRFEVGNLGLLEDRFDAELLLIFAIATST